MTIFSTKLCPVDKTLFQTLKRYEVNITFGGFNSTSTLFTFAYFQYLLHFPEKIISSEVCPKNEFSCGDGNCISNEWRCDGVEDCENGVDEENCSKIC